MEPVDRSLNLPGCYFSIKTCLVFCSVQLKSEISILCHVQFLPPSNSPCSTHREYLQIWGLLMIHSDWSRDPTPASDWLLLMTTASQQQCCGCAGMYLNVDTDPTGENNYPGSRQMKIHRFISMYRLMTALPSTVSECKTNIFEDYSSK